MIRIIASVLLLLTLGSAAHAQNVFEQFFRNFEPRPSYQPEPRYEDDRYQPRYAPREQYRVREQTQRDPEHLRTIVSYPGLEKGVIVISPFQRRLYLGLGGGRALRYAVGVGKEKMAWHGIVHVGRKQEWPSWTPPAEMRVRVMREQGRVLPVTMAGGPANPLGARALYLYEGIRDTQYRIHGTNEPDTIGEAVSSGCIRMMNDDVEDLYERVPIGAVVHMLNE